MLSSTRTITTDLRHIDPNPDRLQLVSTPTKTTTNSQSPVAKPNSLLLLSTSAEAAVAESKRFERRSRHSSLCTTSSPPTTHPTTNNPINPINPINPSSRGKQLPKHSVSSPSSLSSESQGHHSLALSQSPLRNSYHIQHRLPSNTPPTTTAPNHHNSNNNSSIVNRRDQTKSNHLFKCEKCLKVYRHPQCLVKHRWEHTEYWADASKLMLSKHQQVQMLEAAAILAAPSGSLPESRSLWPAAVSSSEAGLLGSDRVNLEVICSQRPAIKNMNHHPHYHRHSSSVSYGITRRTSDITDVEMSEETGSRRSIEEEDGEDNLEEDDDNEDEIMFEMSLDGDESVYPHGLQKPTAQQRNSSRLSISSKLSNSSVSGPPPIGYFERRNPESVSSVISDFEKNHHLGSSSTSSSRTKSRNLVNSLPATVAYQPPKLYNNTTKDLINHQPIGFAYHSSESIFKPITPYQDSQLRFETPHRFSSNNDGGGGGINKKNGSGLVQDHQNIAPLDDDTEEDDEDDAWSRSVDPEREREGDEVVGMEL